MKKLIAIFLLLLLLTSCVRDGNSPVTDTGSGQSRYEPAEPELQTEETTKTAVLDVLEETAEPTDEYNWIIEVNDTKKGVYSFAGKSFNIEATLFMVAEKSGGFDIYGDYQGSFIIDFKVDYSGLSDNDVLIAGYVAADKLCTDMSFSIQPYNLDEYDKIKKPNPDGSISVVPLVQMDGMSSFMSNYKNIKWENWNATGKGKVYLDVDTEYTDGEITPVGINLLTKQEEITVDIPTYSNIWKFGYFNGTITKNTAGKDPEELFNNAFTAFAEANKS